MTQEIESIIFGEYAIYSYGTTYVQLLQEDAKRGIGFFEIQVLTALADQQEPISTRNLAIYLAEMRNEHDNLLTVESRLPQAIGNIRWAIQVPGLENARNHPCLQTTQESKTYFYGFTDIVKVNYK